VAAGELPGGRARPKTGKSEQTRAAILGTAMRLFQERGYDRTTMRAIAQEAGVSVGNAYYYFESKEFLIQGFYDLMTRDHARDATARMEGMRDFAERWPPGWTAPRSTTGSPPSSSAPRPTPTAR
jgi:AcrR family transcriptional regulator